MAEIHSTLVLLRHVLLVSGSCHLMTFSSLGRTNHFPAYILLSADHLTGDLISSAHICCEAGADNIPMSQMKTLKFRRFSNCLRSPGKWPRRRLGLLLPVSQRLSRRLHAGITRGQVLHKLSRPFPRPTKSELNQRFYRPGTWNPDTRSACPKWHHEFGLSWARIQHPPTVIHLLIENPPSLFPRLPWSPQVP